MNIIKKKINTNNERNHNHEVVIPLFSELNESVDAYIEKSLDVHLPSDVRTMRPVIGSFSSFDTTFQKMEGILFALGTTDAHSHQSSVNCKVIVEISTCLAKQLLSARLGDEDQEKVEFGLFDQILIQPLAEKYLKMLNKLGVLSDEADIVTRLQKLGDKSSDALKGLPVDRKSRWISLAFNFPALDQLESIQPKTQKKTKKKNKLQDPPKSTIRLHMAETTIDALQIKAEHLQDEQVFNPETPWGSHMYDVALGARCMLELALDNVKLNVGECTRLKLGQVIPLPGTSHERLQIKMRIKRQSQILSWGTLGVYKVHKAVRFTKDIQRDFFEDFKTLTR